MAEAEEEEEAEEEALEPQPRLKKSLSLPTIQTFRKRGGVGKAFEPPSISASFLLPRSIFPRIQEEEIIPQN